MKFQNSSIHDFKVMLCIKKRDERTDGRKDGRTDGRTEGRTNNPEAICPSNFFEVGGITNWNSALVFRSRRYFWYSQQRDRYYDDLVSLLTFSYIKT